MRKSLGSCNWEFGEEGLPAGLAGFSAQKLCPEFCCFHSFMYLLICLNIFIGNPHCVRYSSACWVYSGKTDIILPSRSSHVETINWYIILEGLVRAVKKTSLKDNESPRGLRRDKSRSGGESHWRFWAGICCNLIYILKEFICLQSQVLLEGGKTLQEAGNQLGRYGCNPISDAVAWTKSSVKVERGG